MDIIKIKIILACVVILSIVFMLGTLYIVKKINKGQLEAQIFLDSIRDTLYDRIYLILKDYNYDSRDSIVGIESEIIEKSIYDLKDLVSHLIEESAESMSKWELNSLNNKLIDSFVTSIINEVDIPATIDNINVEKYESAESKFAEEDKQLQEEYSNSKLYIEDEKELDNIKYNIDNQEILEEDKDGIEKRGFTLPSKEEESKLLPQSELEESYDSEDISMEVIPDNVFVDSKGRLHDKVTGRYIKEV